MQGFVKTAGVKYVEYRYVDENHLFKDDYIYISYDKPIRTEIDDWGYNRFVDFDVQICGSDIVPILFFVEKYSPNVETAHVRKKIQEKFRLYKEHYYDDFKRQFQDDTDIFEYMKQFMHYHIIKRDK